MSIRKVVGVAVVVVSGVALGQAVPAPGVDLDKPLPSDPRVVSGEFENGLHYRVMQNAKPPGKVALYLHVDSGSLNEKEEQRGVAHYLEHMAFNGSENFPPNTVINFFQSMGLTFGQHQNAFTSFDQTTFILDMPDNKGETLDKGMNFFSDVAFKLTLEPKEIDEERQVIMNEKRSRLSGRQRVQDYIFERIAPGSIFGQRLPIGIEKTIMGAQRPVFADYYTHWYVPSNMTLMVVGDMDPQAMVAHAKKWFAAGAKVPAPVDVPVGVHDDTQPRAIVAQDKEITRASVSIERIGVPHEPSTTLRQARADAVEFLGVMAFNRRLQEKVAKGDVAFQGGRAGIENMAHVIRIAGVDANGEGQKWQQMLGDAGHELARAVKFGFTAQEIDLVRKDMLSELEQGVATESGTENRALLGRMNTSVSAREPMMSPQQELDLARQYLSGITPQEVSAAFADAFKGYLLYTVQLPADVKAPTEAELVSLGEAAVHAEVKEEAHAARADKLMDALPSAGGFTGGSEHAASKIWSGWLGNNASFHHRFMDYQKNEVSVHITLYGGTLLETAKNRGITQAATLAWSRPATSKLPSTDIRDLLAGKKVNVRGGAGDDSIDLNISGNPEELEFGMQLAFLLLTDPKIEPAAFDQWKTRELQSIAQRDKDPASFAQKVMPETIYPTDDVRTQPLTKEQVEAMTLDAAQAYLKKLIATSPIEVSVVGDLPLDKAKELAARYVGSLPSRDKITPQSFADLRKLPAPKGPKVANKSMDTQTPMSLGAVGFYGPDQTDVADARRMSLAARILTTRMIQQIREKEQLVYSIGARVNPGTTFPGYGLVMAAAPCKTENADKLAARVKEVFAQFAEKGFTADELETAKKQTATDLEEQMKKPGYWARWMNDLSFTGRNLDDLVSAPEAYQAITADEIMAAYRKYYRPSAIVEIVIKGKAEDATDAAPAPAPGKSGG